MFTHSVPLSSGALTLINGTLVTDGSGVSIGSTNYPVDGMSPSEKRTKLYVRLTFEIVMKY